MQQIIIKTTPTKMEFNAKGVSRWSRNRCKQLSKNNAKTCNVKNNMKIIKNHVSRNGKIIEIHCKNIFLWFRRLHVRTGKGSTKTSKMSSNSI